MWAGPSLPCPRRKDGEDARTFLGGERNLRPALAAQRGHLCCPANGGPDGRPLLRQYPCCSGSRILFGRLRDPYQRVLNVLFPAYYVLVVRREGLNQLGIT